MRIPPSFIFGTWCGLLRGAFLYVVRSFTWCGPLRGAVLPGRKHERSEASRALGCADDCADYGPGGPHHHRAANTSAARRLVRVDWGKY